MNQCSVIVICFSILSPPSADVPLQECLSYEEMSGGRQVVEGRGGGGGGGEEEANIYEATDLAMEVSGGQVAIYEN